MLRFQTVFLTTFLAEKLNVIKGMNFVVVVVDDVVAVVKSFSWGFNASKRWLTVPTQLKKRFVLLGSV